MPTPTIHLSHIFCFPSNISSYLRYWKGLCLTAILYSENKPKIRHFPSSLKFNNINLGSAKCSRSCNTWFLSRSISQMLQPFYWLDIFSPCQSRLVSIFTNILAAWLRTFKYGNTCANRYTKMTISESLSAH